MSNEIPLDSTHLSNLDDARHLIAYYLEQIGRLQEENKELRSHLYPKLSVEESPIEERPAQERFFFAAHQNWPSDALERLAAIINKVEIKISLLESRVKKLEGK